MTREQLDAIRARYPVHLRKAMVSMGGHAWDDAYTLIAEVERLTAERDTFKKEAERFAKAIHTRGCQQQSAYNATCVCGADEHQRDLRTLAFQRGVAAMREAAAQIADAHCVPGTSKQIRALPDPEDK